jgi:cyclic pyranopterin phosphate synthase
MVDIGHKVTISRRAVAEGDLVCAPATILALRAMALPKGDVLAVARIAGIQAAKRTAELIPLCHALPLDRVSLEFEVREDRVRVACSVSTAARTGVEMEALTGAAVAALTLYDMMKAADKAMRVENLHVVSKTKGP